MFIKGLKSKLARITCGQLEHLKRFLAPTMIKMATNGFRKGHGGGL